jgi:hypothetical protein
VTASRAHLFKPRDTIRMRVGGFGGGGAANAAGQNPPAGVLIDYYLAEAPRDGVTIEILDRAGKVIRTLRSRENTAAAGEDRSRAFLGPPPSRVTVPAAAGMNRFEWDMRYPDAPPPPPGTNLFGASIRGPEAVPGAYQVRLTASGQTFTQPFAIRKDPRTRTTADDFDKQFALLTRIHERLADAHNAIADIQQARADLKDALSRAGRTPAADALRTRGEALDAALASVQDELVQMNIRNGNDVLTYPAKLNNLIAALAPVVAATDTAPTAQSYQVFEDLSRRLDAQLTKLSQIEEKDVAAFNAAAEAQRVPAIPRRPRLR